MSQISDLILKQVQAAATGSDLNSSVLSGLSDSVLNSIKQTASSANGIVELTNLFTGKTAADSSSVTSLATQIFSSQVANKLGLSSSTSNAATSLLPVIINGLVSVISSKGSNLDVASVLSSLGTASNENSTLGKIGKIAGTLGKLGGLFKK